MSEDYTVYWNGFVAMCFVFYLIYMAVELVKAVIQASTYHVLQDILKELKSLNKR
jgi:hypothetical protein